MKYNFLCRDEKFFISFSYSYEIFYPIASYNRLNGCIMHFDYLLGYEENIIYIFDIIKKYSTNLYIVSINTNILYHVGRIQSLCCLDNAYQPKGTVANDELLFELPKYIFIELKLRFI